jgi:hypothetical protein
VDANEMIERRACITGVGQSEIGRRLYRDRELISTAASQRSPAGLNTADIDGLSTYRSDGHAGGFSGAGAQVMGALRLNCGWYGSGLETSGQLGSVSSACLAVASGLANHVCVLPVGLRRLGAGEGRSRCPAVAGEAAVSAQGSGVEPPVHRRRRRSACPAALSLTARPRNRWRTVERA